MHKRNRERSVPMIHVQTYFTITEAPFGRPVDLTYGAIVAVPAKFAHLFSYRAMAQPKGTIQHWITDGYSFHLAIQLPGAFIVR